MVRDPLLPWYNDLDSPSLLPNKPSVSGMQAVLNELYVWDIQSYNITYQRVAHSRCLKREKTRPRPLSMCAPLLVD
jgi:hypothetical protein